MYASSLIAAYILAVAISMAVNRAQAEPDRVAAPPGYAAVFEKAFGAGFKVQTTTGIGQGETRTDTVTFNAIEIGKLILKSNRICASDPFVFLGDTKAALLTDFNTIEWDKSKW
jgi:hypothetical protein